MNSEKINSSTTAILLFTQSEEATSVLKPINSSKKKNRLLWKKLNDRVLKTIQKTKLPYFVLKENNQVGATFGKKITSCIQEVFDKGFQKVIVVGNDCLALNTNHLNNAIEQLQHNHCVLGADFNGGAYLIGLTQSTFRSKEFQQAAWQTVTLFSSLQKLFNGQPIGYLPPLDDFNSIFDFKRVVYKLPYDGILRSLFLSFLIVPKIQILLTFNFIVHQFISISFNKGSPLYLKS
ncbi:DUF2064 domain-containing protein [Gaetbulibacter sp. M235]|uniref:DUF2064 domain-containing protein n=1 Tax=Gaetbulibacter sp. M235 TaxID=3126510 RepID=UPI00374E7B11